MPYRSRLCMVLSELHYSCAVGILFNHLNNGSGDDEYSLINVYVIICVSASGNLCSYIYLASCHHYCNLHACVIVCQFIITHS